MLDICFQMATALKQCKWLFIHLETYICSDELKKGGKGIRIPFCLLGLTKHLPPSSLSSLLWQAWIRAVIKVRSIKAHPKPVASGCAFTCCQPATCPLCQSLPKPLPASLYNRADREPCKAPSRASVTPSHPQTHFRPWPESLLQSLGKGPNRYQTRGL